jgi:hypothetical protein
MILSDKFLNNEKNRKLRQMMASQQYISAVSKIRGQEPLQRQR